ncbi:BolA family transcriptional regulator, partial [Enterobacter hormaechei subsp. steigerwaltii]|nr:BolA family transcriptional regulator [Enterobacter hormaechei subsp. steigerwaltii]
MLTPEQVKAMIEGVAKCEHIEVEGDGHHFFAVIVASEFEG